MFKIVHLSDLHLRKGWHEDQGILLGSFFNDLAERGLDRDRDLLVFSGDLVQAGSSTDFINEFAHRFGNELEKYFRLENRLFCPGNHDVDRGYVEQNLPVLLPIAEARDSETEFNSNIASGPVRSLISPKFSNIFSLQGTLFGRSLTDECLSGTGFVLNSECAIYILNTSLYSFGGADGPHEHPIEDKGKLRIDTRSLHRWLAETSSHFKILVVHHPAKWMVPWAQRELDTIARINFNLLLQGHEHDPDSYARSRQQERLIVSNAPALHTHKLDHDLGYSIITFDIPTSVSIEYRQWAPKDRKFVAGTTLAGNDSGIVSFLISESATPPSPPKASPHAVAWDYLQSEFQESLAAYRSISATWVEPTLSKSPEFSDSSDDDQISPTSFAEATERALILGTQLSGLTTLARYICLDWWQRHPGQFILFAKVSDLPGHVDGIKAYVQKQLEALNLTERDLHGFALDADNEFAKAEFRRLNGINKAYPAKRLFIFHRLPPVEKVLDINRHPFEFQYETYYLKSMEREGIRSLVRAEIQSGTDFDEDYMVQRIVDDLEVLNVHRTPLNVKTLLAIARIRRDSSPINRTQMLSQFLLIVFQNNVNLRYEATPDLLDSTYAIGSFCSKLLTSGKKLFSKRDFLDDINSYCEERAVDLDVEEIFTILVQEKIIVEDLGRYFFNYTYWIYFFAAHHMYADTGFKDFVFENMRYAAFPEVIEFYSGIDRHRSDLIGRLTSDLSEMRESFEKKSQIPRSASLHDHLRWELTEKAAENLPARLTDFLAQTDLPTEVKDQIADTDYDYSRPYSQSLRQFIDPASFGKRIYMSIAAARALRNSDHVGRKEKYALLIEILSVWKNVVQTATLMAPDIVRDSEATYEDVIFFTSGEKDDRPFEIQLVSLLMAIPSTVARVFHGDIATKRMGPLFSEASREEEDETLRYFVAAQMLLSKPRGWVHHVSDYIASLERNSFYLFRISRDLERDFRTGFNGTEAQRGIQELLSKIVAKHQLKITKPNKKTLNKISSEIDKRLKDK